MKPHLANLFEDYKRRRWEAFFRALGVPVKPPQPSKYRRKPGEGRCLLSWDSGIKKRMRAMARGLA